MGAQGRTALAEILLGSKAERVARLAPIPVTIVRDRRGEANAG
jgi:nucleotide-binding universal stress UspA family protein